MKQFATLKELNDAFISGDFKLDGSFVAEGVQWNLLEGNPKSVLETVRTSRTSTVLYTNESNKNTLVFGWQTNNRNAILPSGVALVEGDGFVCDRADAVIIEEAGEKITIRPDQLVGDTVRVSFTSLSNPKEIQGKVDTGATVCSLHADNYKINGNQISFVCSSLSPNTITVPLKTQHAVKSPDGGTVYRPVIELDVKINGKLLRNVMFNLNDRSHMNQPVLIGQNALQAGRFYVDPKMTEAVEGIDWELVEATADSIPMLNRNANEELVKALCEQLSQTDITFKDLIQHIRHNVIKTFEDME
jgi:hypothetical protein